MKNGNVKANIIDFEALEYAPRDYQLASMLISGMLLEGEKIEKIDRVIEVRGKDKNRIYYLMQIRALKGLNFFLEHNTDDNPEKQQASLDLLKRYIDVNKMLYEKSNIKDKEVPTKEK